MSFRRVSTGAVGLWCAVAAVTLLALPASAQASGDIVLYASDATNVKGNWAKASVSGAAGGTAVTSSDLGWSTTDAPLASPSNYFEFTFDAPAGTSYRVWLRLRAGNNSKWNDAVWVQFSDSTLPGGSTAYRIGTTSGLLVNLERCGGCGLSGWGWQNTAYWLSQETAVRFSSSGQHTLRIQTREDGVEVDQVVLSPATYYSKAPGSLTNDSTIVPKTSSKSSPYSGSGFSLPGTVYARDFDNGGQNVAYYDTTAGNAGGAYRSGDVDLQASSEGGHNIGWTAPGEWLQYTVNVGTSGTYAIRLRVASPNSGTSVRVAFDKSGVSQSVSVPNTGGWQAWRTVEFNASLAAGQQILRLSFPNGGLNITKVEVVASSSTSSSSSSSSTSSATPYTGSAISLPGTVEAANFDNGGQGVAYYDTTSGNSGSAYRNTDVDIQASSVGGYNVGWTAAGEWLNYTVNVASAGSYTVQLRVASPSSGNSIQVGFNGPSSVWQSVSIPNSGGWQAWTTVSLPVTLGAGTQQLTIRFNTGGVNLRSIAVGTSSTSTTTSSGTGGSFRMMTWNIHHGKRKDGVLDLASQVKFIVSHSPHVVVLQEVQTWDEHQPSKLKSLIEQQTGVKWHLQWAPVTASSGTEGNVVLTRLPVTSSTYYQMHANGDWSSIGPNRSVAQATVTVGGVPVHVFSTHLDYANTSYRTAQLLDMMEWTAKFGAKRIVGGDFNSWWGEWWITTMMSEYYDTWQDVTGSNQNGYTVNNAVRFDYLFRSKIGSDKITPTKVYVPSTSLSDHNPVIADYTVKP
jgi:endonuclease/exonuclease/phosphatase family metal-dependent hydrolase